MYTAADVLNIKRRNSEVTQGISVIQGAYGTLLSAKTKLVCSITAGKEILIKKPEIEKMLQEIQSASQSSSIDIFQGLTTEMLHDAMPDNKDYSVKFDLFMERGTPSLDIYLEKPLADGSGKSSKRVVREEIIDGQGGSISNVIVSALRIISLARTSNRRFMMLDEPDCWLDERYLKTFSSVVKNISHEIGIQTVIVSHKSSDYFSGGCRVIEVFKEDSDRNNPSHFRLLADDSNSYEVVGEEDELKKDLNKTFFMEGVGIRYVRLINFMSFEDSTIALCPTVNVIVGTNNYGKSVLRLAMKAVSENKGKENYIRHGAESCIVEIGVENNAKIVWEYKRKGAKKTSYTYLPDENEPTKFLRDERGGRDAAPEYVQEALAIGLVDDFDIQLTHQKSPLFVLDPNVTSTRRAKILSLGKESNKIQEMMAEFKLYISETKAKIALEEAELIRIDDKIDQIKNYEQQLNSFSDEQSTLESTLASIEKTAELESLISKMEALNVTGDILSTVKNISLPTDIIGTLNVEKIDEINKHGIQLVKLKKQADVLELVKGVSLPDVPTSRAEDISVIESALREDKKREILSQLPTLPEVPVMKYEHEIFGKINVIVKSSKALKADIAVASTSLAEVNDEREILINKMGGICPLCEHSLCAH